MKNDTRTHSGGKEVLNKLIIYTYVHMLEIAVVVIAEITVLTDERNRPPFCVSRTSSYATFV